MVAFDFVQFTGCPALNVLVGAGEQSRTLAPARTVKAATTSKPNKIKSNHMHPT
jgi:hypothetical protein